MFMEDSFRERSNSSQCLSRGLFLFQPTLLDLKHRHLENLRRDRDEMQDQDGGYKRFQVSGMYVDMFDRWDHSTCLSERRRKRVDPRTLFVFRWKSIRARTAISNLKESFTSKLSRCYQSHSRTSVVNDTRRED